MRGRAKCKRCVGRTKKATRCKVSSSCHMKMPCADRCWRHAANYTKGVGCGLGPIIPMPHDSLPQPEWPVDQDELYGLPAAPHRHHQELPLPVAVAFPRPPSPAKQRQGSANLKLPQLAQLVVPGAVHPAPVPGSPQRVRVVDFIGAGVAKQASDFFRHRLRLSADHVRNDIANKQRSNACGYIGAKVASIMRRAGANWFNVDVSASVGVGVVVEGNQIIKNNWGTIAPIVRKPKKYPFVDSSKRGRFLKEEEVWCLLMTWTGEAYPAAAYDSILWTWFPSPISHFISMMEQRLTGVLPPVPLPFFAVVNVEVGKPLKAQKSLGGNHWIVLGFG